jgi:rod shape-determining protein MreC
VHDKTVRRRRAVLVLLVVLSLILLTAYFGEAPSGGLHSVQRGFLTVISPVQDGANKALKPVRDMFGWFGDTLHAKSQRNQLRKEVASLRRKVVSTQVLEHQNREFLALFHLDQQISASDYRPVTATVVGKSPNIWYQTVDVDAGGSKGVHINDPVVNGEGLVGKVTEVASDGAQVSLINDSTVEVTAAISATGATGIIQPKIGDPNDLLMQFLPANTTVNQGDFVITAGSSSGHDESLYPRGIPIGEVTSVDESSPYKSVNVHPVADLHNLDVVQILTAVPGGRAARLSQTVSDLPTGQQSGSTEAQEGQVASTGGGG